MARIPFIGENGRKELLGFLLVLLAGFLVIALATHNSRDIELLSDSVTWSDLFHVEIDNAVGLAGVWSSQALLWSVGKSAFLLLGLLILAGWRLLFQYDIAWLRKRLLLVFGFAFSLGALWFLLNINEPDIGTRITSTLAGQAGLYVAGLLHSLIGKTGGFAVLAAVLVVTFFSVVPVQRATLWLGIRRGGTYLVNGVVWLWRKALVGVGLLSTVRSQKASDDEAVEEVIAAGDERRRRQTAVKERSARDVAGESDTGEDDDSDDDDSPRRRPPRRRKRKSIPGQESLPFDTPGDLLELLDESPRDRQAVSESELKATGAALAGTLATFGIEIIPGSLESHPGPVVTRYEFKLAPGIKLNQIINLADDVALALKASRIRIAPVPGKAAVGVEIPNREPQTVYIRDVLGSKRFGSDRFMLPLALGKDIAGEPIVADLAKMPHLLIAGSTGSGKSVCLNAVITSLLYRHTPDSLRLILVDPKILELSVYSEIPYLARPVVNKARKAEQVLAIAVQEMEDRYKQLAQQSVRTIADYNLKVSAEERLPYLVIIVDELADMMMSASSAKVELLITRLAQMARAVGIHLILATQRPSVDVITGLIKANFSSRIAFQVASKVDSRTILDANGAEKLLGNGDMLFLYAGAPEPVRIHGCWISSAETERIVNAIKVDEEEEPEPLENFSEEKQELILQRKDQDVLMPEATELVIRHKQGSVSLLQRRLGIGYQRAARLMDQLEAAGVVGPADGAKARDVLVDQSYLEQKE
ncbi:MAG: DNA translocase FtsK 4TM domain-containing protein [bacterium]